MRILPKRRRLEGKTNYTKRRRLLEGKKPRICIRKSNKYILINFITSREAQDKVEITTLSKELLDYGWPKDKIGSLKNLTAAYLTGFLFGKKLKESKNKTIAILDTGLIKSTKGSRIYAAAKGIIESGYPLNCGESVFPEKEKIETEDAKAYFDKIKKTIETKQNAK